MIRLAVKPDTATNLLSTYIINFQPTCSGASCGFQFIPSCEVKIRLVPLNESAK
ncbi:hypothetical protein [Leptospira bouyouniensis]|uniref:hypothetical protein n=1 Tax=Leptospira bouyouniensis TaxID=2484911 RepID=UPI00142D5D2A|nr:hypothetical protein [Leptospira bouyouniensis]